MEDIGKRLEKTIIEHHMLAPGSRVIAAVSGGADSVCLLALLWNLKKEWNLDLRAVHVHHGLRAEEADRDGEFVMALCRGLDVPCRVVRVDVRRFASGKGMSEEEAGRILRYEALEREAREWECEAGEIEREAGAMEREAGVKIAVAHHSGDQAETILHNLLRGSGLLGLRGIPYVRGRIIRPLLDTDRREIIGWLCEHGFSWVQDSSNGSDHYTRNRIRSRLLPLIEEEVNQGAVGNILRMGRLAGQADEYMRLQGECWLKEHVKPDRDIGRVGGPADFPSVLVDSPSAPVDSPSAPADSPPALADSPSVLVPLAPLLEQPEIIRSYVIMELLKRLAGSARDLGEIHVRQVLELAGRPVGREVHLPYSLLARREYDSIFMGRTVWAGENPAPALPDVEIIKFPYKKGTHFPKNRYTKWFDCDRIKDTPVVRTRRPGDFITLADGSHKTLKRFMIDEKIPRQIRDQVPLLADQSHVMWVIGYRISEYYKIGPDTLWVMQAEAGSRGEEKDEGTEDK